MTAQEAGDPAAAEDLPGGAEKKPWNLMSQTNHDDLSAELLQEAAEIEGRLRKHVLELLEPFMRKMSFIEARLREVGANLQVHAEHLKTIDSRLEGAETLRRTVETFRVQLTEADLSRTMHEQRVGDRLSGIETEIGALRSTNEQKQALTKGFERTLKQMGDLLVAQKEEIEALRSYCADRLDMGRDKVAKLRDEFETKAMHLGNVQQRLEDVQTQTNMEVAHVQEEVRRVAAETAAAFETAEDLARSKASMVVVLEQQQEHTEFARSITSQVGSLKQQFGSLIDDVKAHFHTAAETVGITTARQVDDVRAKYQEEAKRIKGITAEMDAFLQEQRSAQTALEQRVAEAKEEAQAGIASVHEQLKDHSKSREQAASSLAIEVKQIKSLLSEVNAKGRAKSVAGAGGAGGGGAAQGDVVSMLVECQLLSAALDWQDDQDRKSVALYGYKAGDGKPPPGVDKPWALPQIDAPLAGAGKLTPRRKLRDTGTPAPKEGVTPVMTIDKRCLSCSSSAATVLAGFKLACLEYAASPVEYQKVTYSRSELIKLQMDLLHQAKSQLRAGD